MLGYLFRILLGVIAAYLVRQAIELLTSPVRRVYQNNPPQPSPRTSRIRIDRDNIVDAKFEDLSNQNRS
jgi:hypothetical protein